MAAVFLLLYSWRLKLVTFTFAEFLYHSKIIYLKTVWKRVLTTTRKREKERDTYAYKNTSGTVININTAMHS